MGFDKPQGPEYPTRGILPDPDSLVPERQSDHPGMNRRLRHERMNELRGKSGLEASFTRMRLILEDLLDGVWSQMERLDPGQHDKELAKEARSLNDSLLKLIHEHRGLDKDGTFAVQNMSRQDKSLIMVEFFRELPIDEQRGMIVKLKEICR